VSTLDRKLYRDLASLRGQVLAIALIVTCGITSLVTMTSSQRDQIAVIKAFGYTNLEVGLHFLKFVLVVVLLLGTSLGLGYGLGRLFTQFYGRYYQFPAMAYQASVGVMAGAIAVSLGAALAGAYQAVSAVVSLGDSTNLELVADLLSTDAVQVKPGARVLINRWGGDQVQPDTRVRSR